MGLLHKKMIPGLTTEILSAFVALTHCVETLTSNSNFIVGKEM